MEASGQLHAHAALPPRKESRVPSGQEAGWAPDPVWTLWSREKSLSPAGNQTRAVHPVAGCYTYWAIQSTLFELRSIVGIVLEVYLIFIFIARQVPGSNFK
jgi:hypothetical protein